MSTRDDLVKQGLLPDTIGTYKVQSILGRGGMGVIYKAIQEGLDRPVALKVLMPLMQADAESSKRFEIEAKAISMLEHQNIVSIYEYGEANGYHFFAMQYVDGEDLSRRIADKKHMAFTEVVDIAKQMCRGLRYAHSKSVVHRDIKPQNVLINKNGTILLSDFGIAKIFSFSAITVTGMAVGTPEYMSPEQAEGRSLDAQTDIYSLGIVMYEMLTKRPPFVGDNAVAIAYKQVHELPAPPSTRRKDIPKRLELIVLKALKKDKSDRYRTVEEMLEHLDSVDFDEKSMSPTVSFMPGKRDTVSEKDGASDKRITDRRNGDRRREGALGNPFSGEFWVELVATQGIAVFLALTALALLLAHVLTSK